MEKFNKAIFGALIAFVLFLFLSGLAFNWRWQDLSNFGQYVGGIASAIALFLVAYGLIIQQNEYMTSVREQREQTETFKSANQDQLFNLLYEALAKIPDQISFTTSGTNPTVYKGLVAINFLSDAYNRLPNLGNLEPLKNRFPAIEAFVRTYLQTLTFVVNIEDSTRRRLHSDLILTQFQSSFAKLTRVESQALKIGLDPQLLQTINTIVSKLQS